MNESDRKPNKPLTILMTPKGEPFYAATYLPILL